MSNVLWLVKNNFKVTFKKKYSIVVFFVLPVILISLLVAIKGSSSTGEVNIGIIDNEKSQISQDMIQSIKGQEKFAIQKGSRDDLEKRMVNGELDSIVIIPKDFSYNVPDSETKGVDLESLRGSESNAWLNNYINNYLNSVNDIVKYSKGDSSKFKTLYNSFRDNSIKITSVNIQDEGHSKSVSQTGIGTLIMFMMLCAASVSEMILKEKRNRTYYRIRSSGMKSQYYIAANVLSGLIIVSIQTALILLVMINFMHMQIFIPFFTLMLLLIIFSASAVGLGLAIVAFSNDSKAVGAIQSIIIAPTCMIGGCFWSLDFMPDSVRKVSNFVPQKWIMDAIQKLQNGSSFKDIIINIAIILGFGITFFILAAYRFKKNQDIKTFV